MLAILCVTILVHILNCPITTQRQKQGCVEDTYSQPGNDHADPKRKKNTPISQKALQSSLKEPKSEANSLSCCVIWKINFCTGQ